MAIKIKQLKTKDEVFANISSTPDAQGCEICKPAIGSILSSLYNEHVMKPQHHHNQDTNDRFLGNIQRNGTFSVVPRIPGGEVTPERLVAIGKVASDYGLYTKITGGQRIDMFGAQKQDLPAIWTRLHEAGLESGKSPMIFIYRTLTVQVTRMENRCVQSRVVSVHHGVGSV